MWGQGALQMWRWGFEAGRAYEQRQSVPMCEQLDFDEPGDWPVRALGPLPKIDPRLDRLRYPPHGRRSWMAGPDQYHRPGEWVGLANGGVLPLW